MATLKETAPHLSFDNESLMQYLRHALGMPIKYYNVLQYEGGQSNPTYLLELDGEKFVLRRRPPGNLLPSAHAIDREYRIMKALQGTDVPVPEVILFCENPAVIGTTFFLMKHVEGRIFELPQAEGVSPKERSELFEAFTRTLATLHKLDPQKVGLSNYGKVDNYVQRQISRWTKQFQASKTENIQAMDSLIEYLPLHVPVSKNIGIVHGDYRLGNVMFHPTKPQVVAVLDWEISTLGDSVSDLAYSCIDYYLPSPRGFLNTSLHELGIPTEKERLELYFGLFGSQPLSTADWNFYVAFNLFRLAAIVQGVYARALQGNASSSEGLSMQPMGKQLAETAVKLLNV